MIQPKQSIGIFTTDLELKVRSWDRWLTGVTGLSANIVRGTNLMELFPELETSDVRSYFERVLREGMVEWLSVIEHPYLIPCPPQAFSRRFQQMQQNVTIAPLRDKDHIIGIIVTIEDRTPQLDREQDLSELTVQLDITETSETFQQTEQFLADLGNANWQNRQSAVESLVRQGGPTAVVALVCKVRDEHQDLSVLNSALKALTRIKGDIITPLTELLRIPDVDLRGYAVLALGDQTDRRAIPALVQALNDDDVNVRYNAIEALGKLQAQEATLALVDIVKSGDFFLAFPALDALKRIGDPSVIPHVVSLLTGDELLRDPIIELLGQLGDETVVTPLATLLNEADTPTNLIAQAITALYDRYQELYNEGEKITQLTCQSITDSGVHYLITTLNEAKENELRALALLLGWLEGTAVEQALTQLLGKPTAQKEVVKALVRYGSRVGQLLLEQLDAPEQATRRAAILALGRIGERRAVPKLIDILSEEDEDLVISAAEALTTLADRQAFAALLNLLSHPDPRVRHAVVAALNALNHPEMSAWTLKLLSDPNPYVRESAIKIVGYVGYRDNFEALLTCCQDSDERVRQAAIESLPYFEDERVIAVLTNALTTATPKVRAAAARAFAAIDNAQATAVLIPVATTDPDTWVRYFAVRSLGELKAVAALEPLLQLAQTDSARQVRIASIEALGKIGQVQAIPVLAALIYSNGADLAEVAIAALGQINHPEALAPLLTVLDSEPQRLQWQAIRALGNHSDPQAAETLHQVAITADDPQLVQEAIHQLARLATPAAITALATLTVQPRWRETCIMSLSQLREPEQIDSIAQELHHPQVSARTAIVEVLSRMKQLRANPHLLTALEDEAAAVRLAAVTALAHLEMNTALAQLTKIASEDPNLAVRRSAQKIINQAILG
ncbi:PBS lyase HEAT domain-containing protein repeat-containing protein [Thioploca ingrica]|uniref:PBS lyase HEAT domain-containing protein repeat-containing protein n=1 Tax=Thioploca ingrica TaxID=40754 RepID=A0A090ABB2_9GAMM|nr:PBS lyase HEAT domain-containing protein repeat-containing protein [Thioploca ingrica]